MKLPVELRGVRSSSARGLLRRIGKAGPIYAMLLPSLALVLLIAYYPALSAIYHSFFDWSYAGSSTFVGFDNFVRMFSDEIFGTSFLNLMQLTAFGVLVKSIIVPIVVAELLFAIRNSRARYYYRIILLVPLVVPGVVIWFIWKFIYEPNVGLLNSIFAVMGLDFLQLNWLGEPRTALFSIMVLGFPWVSGTAVLIYYAGLIGISESVLDAARLDGVTGLQRIRRIDIPLIRGQIKFFLVVGIIDSMKGYEINLVLTNGGPGYSTMVPGLHMYQEAFAYQRMGYASAIGVALFALILILTIVNARFIKSDPGA